MLAFLSNLDMGASPTGFIPDLDFYPDPMQATWVIDLDLPDPLRAKWIIKDGTNTPL